MWHISKLLTVYASYANAQSLGELLRLVEDLEGQLPSRCHHQSDGACVGGGIGAGTATHTRAQRKARKAILTEIDKNHRCIEPTNLLPDMLRKVIQRRYYSTNSSYYLMGLPTFRFLQRWLIHDMPKHGQKKG